jgi:lipopolysaccharide export system protein LptA
VRNSEAQRYARWSLAAAGVLAAAVAGVYARNSWLARQAEKKAPPAVPPTVEQQSNEFSYSKVEGQRTIYTVRASRTTQFKEGSRNLLEDVAIVVYGKKGDRNDKMITRACDFISNTGKISCAGEVQINLQAAGTAQAASGAIQVTTSAVTFDRDSGEARTDKPVKFRWPSGEGHAVGVSYDSNAGTLRALHNVELDLSPSSAERSGSTEPPEIAASPGQKTVHVAGSAMSFQRERRIVQVEGDVHAQQATLELTADELLLELDAQFQARRFVASGHPQLHDVSPQGPLALSADEINSAVRPDGSIANIVAEGNVHGTRNTPVGGDGIEAGRIQVELATTDNVPRLLTATGGVTLTSTSASFNGGTRHMQSDAMEIHFSNMSRPGQTLIETVNTLAPARVDWDNVALVNGKTVPQATRMAGKQMNLKFDGQNQLQQLLSSGDVEVTRKLGDAPEQITASRELTAKFDSTGQWTAIDQTGAVHFHDAQRTGQGERAHTDRASNVVTLDGSVILADETTRTTAQSASFAQSANTLRADGHVLTTDLNAAARNVSDFAQEPAHISAEHLVADTGRGHAVYSGKGRMWQGQSVIEGDTIELDSPTHTLVAKGQVRGVFPQAAWNPKPSDAPVPPSSKAVRPVSNRTPSPSARPGTQQSTQVATQLGHFHGGLLTYWETESRARIEQNARVDSEQGSIQANQIDLFFTDSGAASGTKQLSRSLAVGDVTVHQEDRRGTSERAEYTASEGKFVLSEGKPTLYSSTGDTTTGRQLTFYFADDRIVVDSADGLKTVTLHQVEK